MATHKGSPGESDGQAQVKALSEKCVKATNGQDTWAAENRNTGRSGFARSSSGTKLLKLLSEESELLVSH